MALRINVGCGQTPTVGWRNFDNSPSLWLARHRLLLMAARAFRLVGEAQAGFIAYARHSPIEWADATTRIPVEDETAAVLYSSHMIEHLDRVEVGRFLGEARRVLMCGGIIRLAAPDLKKIVARYEAGGDADSFVNETLLTQPKARSAGDRIDA